MSDSRNVLAIDTSTDTVVAGVAVLSGGSGGIEVRAQRSITDHRRHAELLTTLIKESMQESGIGRDDLDAVVVGCGPGPFTGLRVGMATGAAFGDALGLPVYGVCSLDALAEDARRSASTLPTVVVAVTDARRREVYWARYRDGVRTDGPDVAAPRAVAEILSGAEIDAVAGSPVHADLVGAPSPIVEVPTTGGLVAVAADDILGDAPADPLVPLYLRRPDAVERAR